MCFLFTVLFLFSAPLLTGQKSINTLKRIKYEPNFRNTII